MRTVPARLERGVAAESVADCAEDGGEQERFHGNLFETRHAIKEKLTSADSLGDFAFGFVGGVFDFGVEALEETLDEGVGVGLGVLKLLGEGDVAGEVGEDDAPGEGVFPGARADGDVLALLGDPDRGGLRRRPRRGRRRAGMSSCLLDGIGETPV